MAFFPVHNAGALVKYLVYGLLLAGLYDTTFSWLLTEDWERDAYAYCYLLPFVIAYLLWEKRERLALKPSNPSWMGGVPLLAGFALFWVGELSGEFFTLYISFWLVLVGLCWLHLGWEKLKVIGFPLFMMLAMFPLPNFLYTKISLKLQLASSALGVSLMHLYGMSAFRQGNIIDLGFTQLQVVDACSGLRSLMTLIVLGILMAYFFKAALWKRLVLVLSTIPLSLCLNAARIAMTGVLHEVWGAEVSEGFFHIFSGWLIFMSAFGVLLLEIWGLRGKRRVISHQ